MTNSEAVSMLMNSQYYNQGYKQGVSDVLDKIRAEIEQDAFKDVDAELENTIIVTFQTPQGRQVKYIKCDVLDKIKAEIIELRSRQNVGVMECLDIIDKYMEEKGVHKEYLKP